MTLHNVHSHHGGDEPELHDACLDALSRIQEFLHHELDDTTADVIREHLAACESCLDIFDVESAIAGLIRRCNPSPPCPGDLRAKITSMHVQVTHIRFDS